MRLDDFDAVHDMIRFHRNLSREEQHIGAYGGLYIPAAMWAPLRDHLIPLVEAFLREKGVEI